MIATEQSSQKVANPSMSTVNQKGKLAYLVLLATALALALTGIGTLALGKAPMSGWVLMAHVAFAPLFALGLAAVALTWAESARFGSSGAPQGALPKALLWLILLGGLVVILSAVVPMTPLFGSTGQHALYLTHRYSAIGLAALLVLHLLTRPRK